MDTLSYRHLALQRTITKLRGSSEEDKIFVRMLFFKCFIKQRVRTDPIVVDAEDLTPMSQMEFWLPFSHFENPSPEVEAVYEDVISSYLTHMGVPENQHPLVVLKLFAAIQDALSPVDPVVVFVWEVSHRVTHEPDSVCSFTPASRSFVEGLEVLEPDTVLSTDDSSCAICLNASGQEDWTRLPCTHQFHITCIGTALMSHHLCPICRCPMPTEE